MQMRVRSNPFENWVNNARTTQEQFQYYFALNIQAVPNVKNESDAEKRSAKVLESYSTLKTLTVLLD